MGRQCRSSAPHMGSAPAAVEAAAGPVLTPWLTGSRSVGEADAIPAANLWPGKCVVMTSAGTPAASGSDLMAVGDVAQYNGSHWDKIISNSGGFVPAGTRFLVAHKPATLYSPLTGSQDESSIAEFDGSSNTPALTAGAESDRIWVEGANVLPGPMWFVLVGAADDGVWREESPVLWHARRTSNVTTNNTIGSPQQVLKLSTPLLPAGDYEIGWHSHVRHAEDDYAVYVRMQLDDSTTIAEDAAKFRTPGGEADTSMRHPMAGQDVLPFAAGPHDVDFDLATSNAGANVTCYFCSISLRRASA